MTLWKNGSQSQSFKSPVRQLAFCENEKKLNKTKPVVGQLCLVLDIFSFERWPKKCRVQRKYRLAGGRAEKKKEKSLIDLTVGKFARKKLQTLDKNLFIGIK